MATKVFSGENVEVEIYLDSGSGSASGSVLFTFRFRRAVAVSSDFELERISHLGIEADSYEVGKESCRLTLSKVVEASDKDLSLSDALYYIKVIHRTDTFSEWTEYIFKKCRRISWELPANETGVIGASAGFICESWSKTDL